MQSVVEEDITYCPICYTNEIVPDAKPLTAKDKLTVEFDCKHRFCSECTIQMLKLQIERADVDKIKCFDSECTKPEVDKARLA